MFKKLRGAMGKTSGAKHPLNALMSIIYQLIMVCDNAPRYAFI